MTDLSDQLTLVTQILMIAMHKVNLFISGKSNVIIQLSLMHVFCIEIIQFHHGFYKYM